MDLEAQELMLAQYPDIEFREYNNIDAIIKSYHDAETYLKYKLANG
jgi:hypothetical protein